MEHDDWERLGFRDLRDDDQTRRLAALAAVLSRIDDPMCERLVGGDAIQREALGLQGNLRHERFGDGE